MSNLKTGYYDQVKGSRWISLNTRYHGQLGLAGVSIKYFRNNVMGKSVNGKIFGPKNYLNINSKNALQGKYVSKKIFGGN